MIEAHESKKKRTWEKGRGREREQNVSAKLSRDKTLSLFARQANHVECSAHLLHFTWNWFQLHDTWFAGSAKLAQSKNLTKWHLVTRAHRFYYICKHAWYGILYPIELNGIKLIFSRLFVFTVLVSFYTVTPVLAKTITAFYWISLESFINQILNDSCDNSSCSFPPSPFYPHLRIPILFSMNQCKNWNCFNKNGKWFFFCFEISRWKLIYPKHEIPSPINDAANLTFTRYRYIYVQRMI